MKHQISLSQEELEAIMESARVSGQTAVDRASVLSEGSNTISEACADTLRDACSEHLMVTGFDEEYRTTRLGSVLENLLDKLYIG